MSVEKFVDKAWKVGGLNLFFGLAAAAVIHLVPGLTGGTAAFALLLAAAVTSLSYLILHNRRILQRVLQSSRLGECLADIDSPFLRHLSDRLLAETCNAVKQLSSSRNRFQNPGQYMAWAIPRLQELEAGAEVLAVCGDKPWGTPAVLNFHEANYDAARRGATVKRIFLQRTSRFPRREMDVLDEHWKVRQEPAEIYPLIVRPEQVRGLVGDYRLPEGFGMTLIKSTTRKPVAMVHWGFSGANRGGSYFEDPFIVAQFEQIFAELSENAYAYEGVLEK